eukprot:scaffold129607_cov53-Attheya_sp.AAC.4
MVISDWWGRSGGGCTSVLGYYYYPYPPTMHSIPVQLYLLITTVPAAAEESAAGRARQEVISTATVPLILTLLNVRMTCPFGSTN